MDLAAIAFGWGDGCQAVFRQGGCFCTKGIISYIVGKKDAISSIGKVKGAKKFLINYQEI